MDPQGSIAASKNEKRLDILPLTPVTPDKQSKRGKSGGRIGRSFSFGKTKQPQVASIGELFTKFLEDMALGVFRTETPPKTGLKRKVSKQGFSSDNATQSEQQGGLRRSRSRQRFSGTDPSDLSISSMGKPLPKEKIREATGEFYTQLQSQELGDPDTARMRLFPILKEVMPHIFEGGRQTLMVAAQQRDVFLGEQIPFVNMILEEMNKERDIQALFSDGLERLKTIQTEKERIEKRGPRGMTISLDRQTMEKLQMLTANVDGDTVEVEWIRALGRELKSNRTEPTYRQKYEERKTKLCRLAGQIESETHFRLYIEKNWQALKAFSESSQDVIANPVMSSCFFHYLEREGSSEYGAFFQAVFAFQQEFEQLMPEQRTERARKIYTEFLAEEQGHENGLEEDPFSRPNNFLNLPGIGNCGQKKAELLQAIEDGQVTDTLFDPILGLVYDFLNLNYFNRDGFSRKFRNSIEFQEGLDELSQQQKRRATTSTADVVDNGREVSETETKETSA